MKIEFLEKIFGKIKDEIYCPKCKNNFAENSIEICSIGPSRLNFSSKCHICGAVSQIVADVNIHQPSIASPATQSFINPIEVKKINETLSSFKGKNINDLF